MTDDSVELGRLPEVRMSFQLSGAHVRKAGSQWTFPSHEHPIYELHWVIEGEMEMVIDGKIYPQGQGDLLFIRPGTIHSCKSVGSWGLTYFSMHFSVADDTFSKELERHRAACYASSSPLAQALAPFLTDLANLATQGKSVSQNATKSIKMYVAVFRLLQTLVEHLSQTENVVLTKKDVVAGHIAEHIKNSVPNSLLVHGNTEDNERKLVQDIAQSLKLSPSQVNRIFKQVYGKSPRQYMSEILLSEAKRLLLQTDLSIDHIALMLGYKTCAHFSRQFKRWTAMTPSRYRTTIRPS